MTTTRAGYSSGSAEISGASLPTAAPVVPPAPSPTPEPTPTPTPSPSQEPAPAPAPAPTWIAQDGAAPALPAGSAEWQLPDGSTVTLVASSPAPNQIRYEADGVHLTLTGEPGSSPTGGLVASSTGEVECEVCTALLAGSTLESWMFSTPRLVGAHVVSEDDCQIFTISLGAPLDGGGPMEAGAHTLQLALPTADGMQAINVGVTVGGPVPTSVPAGDGPVLLAGLLTVGLLVAAGAAAAARREVVTG